MRLELREWNRNNFEEKLRGVLAAIKNAEKTQSPKISSLCLVKSPIDSENTLDPIRILNAILGRLGRVFKVDEELDLTENCLSGIRTLILQNFTLRDFRHFIPHLSKCSYPFVQELVLEAPSEPQTLCEKLTVREREQLQRSPLQNVHVNLISEKEGDQKDFTNFAMVLFSIKNTTLCINSEPVNLKTLAKETSISKPSTTALRFIRTKQTKGDTSDFSTLLKKNWLACHAAFQFVLNNSTFNFLITESVLNFLNLLYKSFFYYSQKPEASFSADNECLKALYSALYPKNNAAPALAARVFSSCVNSFDKKELLLKDAAAFFYQEFILCSSGNMQLEEKEVLRLWHEKLSAARDQGHLPNPESYENFKAQAENYFEILKLPGAQALLKKNERFFELLVPVSDLYFEDITHLLQLIDEFYGHAGFENTQKIILACGLSQEKSTHYLPQLLSFSLQLCSNASLFPRFLALLSKQEVNEEYWPVLKASTDELLAELSHQRFPSKSLEDVAKDFIDNADVLDQLPLDELIEYMAICKKIDAYKSEFFMASDDELKQIIADFKNSPKEENSLHNPKILAALREIIKRLYGILPYNLQMINTLALLKGNRRLAQIKSGEGKSTLIALMTAMRVLHGHTVDNITVNRELAQRDAKKYEKFFEFIGSDVTHLSMRHDLIADQLSKPVLYGSIHDFRHLFLLRKLGFPSSRAFDIAIVDEVDSMCIDTNDSPTYIPAGSRFSIEIYQMIWAFVRALAGKSIHREELKAFLAANKAPAISDDQLDFLIDGAEYALSKREGVDYIVQNEAIIIVDHKHTGELMRKSRWNWGCHTFLEIEHNLPAEPDSYEIACVNNYNYFNLYRYLFGVTGTLGSKSTRKDLRLLYGVLLYDSPRYFPSLKIELKPILAKNIKDQMANIIRVALEAAAKGRPVLIIVATIKISKELFEALPSENKQLYNGVQKTTAEHIIALAGNPGMITIATNTAGRGADIIPTPQAEANGGLLEITTFPTINTRVEEQNFCRTGRQGRKGTYLYILNKKDLQRFFPKGMPEEDEAILKGWKKARAKQGRQNSRKQRNEKHYRDIVFTIQTIFWQFLTIKTDKLEELMNLWIIRFDEISRLVTRAIEKELFNDGDFHRIVHEIAQKFMDLCEAAHIPRMAQAESGGNILHFLAKNNLSNGVRLFAFHKPALLLEPDEQEKLPWACANHRPLKAEMIKLTDQARTSPPASAC